MTGCTIISQGCKNCYAMRFAHRFAGEGQRWEGLTVLTNQGPRWSGKIKLEEKQLLKPLSWKKPRMVFVNSMSDLFHEDVPTEYIDKIIVVMALTPQHTYQVLTKRPLRMREYMSATCADGIMRPGYVQRVRVACEAIGIDMTPSTNQFHLVLGRLTLALHNLWLGVSVEDQKTADERIPILIDTPAAIRWLSVEPLLGPVNLNLARCGNCHQWITPTSTNSGKDLGCPTCNTIVTMCSSSGRPGPIFDKRDIDWVVVGGESGHGARPMHPGWVRSIRDQCDAADIAFFFKQWGAYRPMLLDDEQYTSSPLLVSIDERKTVGSGCYQMPHQLRSMIEDPRYGWQYPMLKVGKKAAGREIDGRTWNQIPGRRLALCDQCFTRIEVRPDGMLVEHESQYRRCKGSDQPATSRVMREIAEVAV
jgi:protein gp37